MARCSACLSVRIPIEGYYRYDYPWPAWWWHGRRTCTKIPTNGGKHRYDERNGQLWCDRDFSKGARFVFRLPCKDDDA